MEAGRLRWLVKIQRRKQTQNTYGEKAADYANPLNWDDVVSLYADIQPEGGREFHAKGEMLAETIAIIHTRYYAGIRPEMRVVLQIGSTTRYYDIRKVFNKDERSRELEMHCVEYVQGA